jgi:hypothetical protein
VRRPGWVVLGGLLSTLLLVGACSSHRAGGRDDAGGDDGGDDDGAVDSAGTGGEVADGGTAASPDGAGGDGDAAASTDDGGDDLPVILPVVDAGGVDIPDDGARGSADGPPTSIVVVVTVPGTADIYGAGHVAIPAAVNGTPGVLPTLIELPPGTSRTMTVTDVSGSVDFDAEGSLPPFPADGTFFNMAPVIGPSIEGIAAPATNRAGFLSGVFLGDAEPVNPAPAPYVVDQTAPTINGITLGQVVFIGDGLAGVVPGTGEVQMFRVPDGATRLFLALADLANYSDNVGAITATVRVSP